jgi:hypothetical protein
MLTSKESEDGSGAQRAEGLLYVEVDCPSELEGEFHAWYNLEHVPERLKIPGFLGGHRYAALEGGPRWLAAYWLKSPAVIESREYRQWMGPLMTPWTKRMIASTRVRRSVFRSVRGDAMRDVGRGTGLVAIRYACAPSESGRLHGWHDDVFSPELSRIPGVVLADRYEDIETSEHLVLYRLADPWVTQEGQFARTWTAGWERQRETLASWKRTLYVRIL